MRDGWVYKKLGEVCEIVGGSTPKTNIAEYWEGDNMWVTPAELNGEKYLHQTTRVISDAAVKSAHLQLLPAGTVLLSSRAPIGKVAITTTPMYCNQGFKNAICSDAVKNDFVYWYLVYSKEALQALGTGATFKEISKKTVSEFSIPIPPITTQQQIVSELDLLSHIIDQKRQQLKEYDALAESIFYDMFGDPVENPKGWKVKTLGDICETTSGGTPSSKKTEYYEGGTIPWLRSGEVSQGLIYETELFITIEGFKNSSTKMIPINSVAIAMYGATVGQVGIIKKEMCTNQAVCSIFPSKLIEPIFLMFFLRGMKPFFLKDAIGGAQPNISQGIIKKTNIPLPPLTLQRQFAAKIESIEQQKQLLKESIKETEMLFQSRMDYWFNG